ncbi:MAG: hypothetical protein SO094_01230, partial [Prevotella sp.]|nr:hypothetical protein [Prevotella sp.]
IEPTETEYRAGRNRIRRPEGEISRCIEYTGWLYIAEKEQTPRDFHKKMEAERDGRWSTDDKTIRNSISFMTIQDGSRMTDRKVWKTNL